MSHTFPFSAHPDVLTVFKNTDELKLFNALNINDSNDEAADVSLPTNANTNILFHIGHVLFYADIIRDDHVVYIGNDGHNFDFNETAAIEMQQIKDSHASQWKPYHAKTEHINGKDPIISSIERM